MTRDSLSTLPVFLPVKRLHLAKRRLAPILGSEARRQLVLAMLADVIDAGRAAGLDLRVLSPDPAVLVFAEAAGARPVPEEQGARSLNEVLDWALRASTAEAAMVLLPDTPLATARELLDFVAAGLEGGGYGPTSAEEDRKASPRLVVAPDRSGRGTNALFLRPANVIPMQFGPNSLHRHVKAAEARGVPSSVQESPGLALDIDRPEDIEALVAKPSSTRSYGLVAALLHAPGPVAAC